MSVAALSDELLAGEEVAYIGTEAAREATTAPLPVELDPRVVAALARQGITSLFEHQAEAWAAAARGEHVAVTTGTASGKTLAFNLPVLDAIARDPKARALYLYPTKALAQDQARSLTALGVPGVRPAIYDGDTPTDQRRQVRTWANAILSNPDMLTSASCPITTAGGRAREPRVRHRRRGTCTAACSARTLRTCCDASGAWRPSTGPSRSSCSRPRRSRTPASWLRH